MREEKPNFLKIDEILEGKSDKAKGWIKGAKEQVEIKKIMIEKDNFENRYYVAKIENGHQWRNVFSGNRKDAYVIIRAFKEIGYILEKGDQK